MQITPIQTDRIEAGTVTLQQVIKNAIKELPEKSVLVITSKVVSLCENNVVPIGSVTKDELIESEAEYYLSAGTSKYGMRFTVTDGTLIPTAGIDESNSGDYYVLWPKDVQRSANETRTFLREYYKLTDVGVLITDSTCHPLRRGTIGVSLATSGFKDLKSYEGMTDLFGRKYKTSQSDISGGLAAAAVVTMGEGTERTPLCILSDLQFLEFTNADPSPSDIAQYKISKENDLFGPFFDKVSWIQGGRIRTDKS